MLDTSRSLKLARAALAWFVALPLGTTGCAEDPPIDQSHEAIGASVMLGNTNVEAADDNAAGYAYAFKYTAAQTGTVDGLKLYVGAGNQAQTIQIGLYGDSGTNHPGALLTSGTLSQPTASAWNQAAVTAAPVTQGKTYWIAILSPAGGGAIHLRARGGATGSNETAAGSFASLPATWVQGTQWSGAAMSAVALGSTGTTPPPPPGTQTLVGNAGVAGTHDDTGGGEAYAFKYTAAKSGKVDTLRLYVDTGNAAQAIQLGLYTNNNGHPGTKLTGGTITNPTPNQWNPVAVPTVDVAAGGTYWIALLSPAGGGRPSIRAEGGATGMNESASGSFSNLPATWVNGSQWSGRNLSATADGLVSGGGTTNACGGTVALPHQPGETCMSTTGCSGSYVCSGKDAVVCNAPQSCPVSGAHRVFFDNFNAASGTGGRRVTAGRDGTPCRSGSCAESNWDGTPVPGYPQGVTHDSLWVGNWAPGNELFIRYWARLDADVDHGKGNEANSVGGKLNRLMGAATTDVWCCGSDQAVHNNTSATATNLFFGIQSGPNDYYPWSTKGGQLQDRKWHKIELYIKNDTGGANGVVRTWIDDELILALDRRTHSPGYTWRELYIPSNWSGGAPHDRDHDTNNHLYTDDLEIFTTASTGTAASGSMADGTIVAQ